MPLPGILSAGRVRALAALVANGFGQAAAGLALVTVVGKAALDQGPARDQGWPIVAASLLLGITLFVLRVMQRRQGAAFALGYVREIRQELVGRLFASPQSADRSRLGLVMTRLITDLSAIRAWLADGVASLLVGGPCVTFIVLGAFWIAPDAAPFLSVGVLLWLAVTLAALPSLRRAVRESRRRRGRLASRLGDIVLFRTAFAHFGRSGPATRRIERASAALNTWLIRRAGWSGAARAAGELVTPVIVAILAGYAVLGSPLATTVDTSVLLLLAGLTVAQLSDLARAADQWLAYAESRRRIGSILARPTRAEPQAPISLPRASKGRQLRIEQRAPVAKPQGVVEAAPGSLVQLCGSTPDTRSTFLARVAGLEEDDGLAVFLDDIPLDSVSQRDWRRAVTLVSPAIPLVRGTIIENIAMGAPSTTSQEEIADITLLCGLDLDAASKGRILQQDSLQAVTSMDAARVRVARALARSAAVLLVDDVEVCKDSNLLAAIAAHARSAGTIVIVSCEPEVVSVGFDEIWLLGGH